MPETQPEIAPIVLEGQEAIAQQEDSLVGEFQPKGNFSKKALNSLVKAVRKLQPMYGLKADYPDFDEDQSALPIEFVRILMMIKQSIDDAIQADVLEPESSFVLEEVVDDSSLQLVSGKLGAATRAKAFKQFLSAPPAEQPADEEVPYLDEAPAQDPERTPLPDESEDALEQLFAGRI